MYDERIVKLVKEHIDVVIADHRNQPRAQSYFDVDLPDNQFADEFSELFFQELSNLFDFNIECSQFVNGKYRVGWSIQ